MTRSGTRASWVAVRRQWKWIWARGLVVLPALVVVGYGSTALLPSGRAGDLLVHWPVSLVILLLLTAGGFGRLQMPSGRVTAPVSSATAVAVACLGPVHGLPIFDVGGAALILLVTLGSLPLLVMERGSAHESFSTFLPAQAVGFGVVIAILHVRWGSGGSLWTWQSSRHAAPWAVALVLIAAAGVGTVVELTLSGLVRARTGDGQSLAVLRDEFGVAPALTLSVVSAGPVAALSATVLGLVALPLALLPVALTNLAVRHYLHHWETHRRTILMMSRLTEWSGHTPTAHAERVAALCVTLGRRLGLLERDLRVLEHAALLHDLGQVALDEPIPAGATVLVAPADQHRIAAAGAAIIDRAQNMHPVAQLVAQQSVPFRTVREGLREVPLSARIMRVANAFDDFSAGSTDGTIRAQAIERLHLGLGYEYDPEVVDALVEAVSLRPGDRVGPAR